MTTLVKEMIEDCATVFLKWMDFNSKFKNFLWLCLFCISHVKTRRPVLPKPCYTKVATISWKLQQKPICNQITKLVKSLAYSWSCTLNFAFGGAMNLITFFIPIFVNIYFFLVIRFSTYDVPKMTLKLP